MADPFRLSAEIVDRVSGPMAKIKASLGGLKPTPEMRALRDEMDKLEQAVNRFQSNRARAGGAGGGGDLLGGLGLNIGAVGVLAAIGSALRNTGQQALELRHVSRETGIAAKELKALQSAGERFQIAPETVTQNVGGFVDKLSLLRRGLGEAAGELRQKAPGIYNQLRGSTSNLDALDKYLSFLGTIKDPQTQKAYADLVNLGGLTRMFTDGPDAMAKAWKDARAKGKDDNNLVDDAKRTADALKDMNDQLDKMTNRLAPPVFGFIEHAVKNTATDLENIRKLFDYIGEKLPALPKWLNLDGQTADPAKPVPGRPALNTKAAEIEAKLDDLRARRDYNAKTYAKDDPRQITRSKELAEQIESLTNELKRLREQGASLSPTSYGGGFGAGGLIHAAAFGGAGGFGGGRGLGPPGFDYEAARQAYNGSQQGRVERALRGLPSPGGDDGGAGKAANPSATKSLGDAIAGTESGKAGYDAVLGNGRYGRPEKPVSEMTLDEAFAFGRQVKARHGSSSALGRYQIVGNTMRAAQRALRMSGDEPFNSENQDRMMRWIARNQGLGAWEGLKGNPRAMAAARAAMQAGGAQDAPLVDPSGMERAQGANAWQTRERSNVPGQMSRLRDSEVAPPGSMAAPGDEGMLARARRAGLAGGSQRIDGSIGATVTFRNPPPGMSVSTKTTGVVEERKVDRGRSLANDARGEGWI